MPLNKVKRGSQMYPWCSHTLTILNGACSHSCKYCYVNSLKRFPVLAEKYSGPPRLVESDLQLNLGSGKTIFVCSTGDLFAEAVPDELIGQVLEHLLKFPENVYLLQTKAPARFLDWNFPPKTILGTTVESDLDHGMSRAPSPTQRLTAMRHLKRHRPDIPLMLSIEPIMDFTPVVFARLIKAFSPKFVSIGADSKRHNLPEPPAGKIAALITELCTFTQVKLKSNLSRLGITVDEQAMDSISLA